MAGNKANNTYLFHKFEAANNREGSRATQASRASHLHIAARQLSEMGYRHLSPRNLKRKHVEALVNHWLQAKLAIVTIKSRVSTVRWLARKIGKPNVVPRTNAELGIPDRSRVANLSKAFTLTPEMLARVPSPYVRVSLELEEKFGLRREEATKIRPNEADKGNRLLLQGSWCKGRKRREIPIRTDEQRRLLERAKELALTTPEGSLIPEQTYVRHIKVYERQTYRAGIRSPHGLRHAYAQARYEELTGRPCPAVGGLSRKELKTAREKALNDRARRIISEEMGHSRRQILSVYCGT
ncbi:MAG: integrase domain-containing protein [Candidatus Tectomicrobia bacterium]|nr:integrase domain-containing protein [Candidatus Tectomicrobia bacterium]